MLPSGDSVWTFRIVVPRPAEGAAERVRGWTRSSARSGPGRVRRSVAAWAVDDVVEVRVAPPALLPGGWRSGVRVEVEVSRGRLIRRAGTE